ncbi:RTA1 like protein [Penicillium camemberti]|uniref:RTA1 like protein n=1 Tax=Penicillium camemberti (strain FM 013) TaxID=1429867 RepID=A0A0G4P4J3_PENC3|nr:RTA1 like protein [Penicillium camemberti]
MSNSTDPSDYCTLATCPLTEAYVEYVPSLAGNAFYLAVFAVLLVAQIVLGIRYRTWGYLGGLFGGLVLEVIGYAGRLQIHYNPFLFGPYLEYLICLTIAPAFICASIYICLGRIVIIYGENISRLRARTYTIVFIICDLVSLLLQASGGAVTSIADADQADLAQAGINTMIAGLVTQVVSLAIFMALCLDFAWKVRRNQHKLNPEIDMIVLRNSIKWKAFLGGLALATLTIFVRSVFRVAELQGGFQSSLANNEVVFMILEGAMLAIALLCLTALHPGICFNGQWNNTKWSFHKSRDSEMSLISKTSDGQVKARQSDSVLG